MEGASAWTAFANGGVRESDALLEAEAIQAAAHERQRSLDEYNTRALSNRLGGTDSNLLVDIGTSEPTLTRMISDGAGGLRGRWKGTYTTGVENVPVNHTRNGSAPTPAGFSLLD